jgi:hypothetical protein
MLRKPFAIGTSVAAIVLLWGVAAVSGTAAVSAQNVVKTEQYTIGNGSVLNASATADPNVAGDTANYTIGFTTPSALAGGRDTITIASPSGPTFPSGQTDYFLIDNTSSAGTQTVSSVSVADGGHSVTLKLSKSVPADSSLSVNVIGATNPPSPGTYSLGVSTSQNTTPATTASFSVVAPATAPAFSPVASPALVGGTSTYTVGAFKAASGLAAGDKVAISSSAGAGIDDNVGFPTSAADYKVEDLTTHSSSTAAAVSVAPVGGGRTGQQVIITVAAAIASGDELSVVVDGVRNPTSAQSDLVTAAAPAGTPPATARFIIGTSVASPTVAISETRAGANGVEYMVGFKPTTALPAGSTITLVAPAGTSFSSAAVTLVDSTNPPASANVPASSVHASAVAGSSTANQLVVTAPKAIGAGDSVFVEVTGVTNPPAGTYGGSVANFLVSTSTDTVPVTVPSYTITAGQAPELASIELSSTVPGETASYTIGDLKASATLVAGHDTVKLVLPAGTVLPVAFADYTVADLTHVAFSAHPSGLLGGGSNSVTLTVGATVPAGDYVDIVVAGVKNPPPGVYKATLAGNIEASVAPHVSQPVPPPPVRVSVRATTTTVSSSANPAQVGQAVTYIATISPAATGGSVVFVEGGHPIARCSGQPVTSGHAYCRVRYWKGGKHAVRAIYSGTKGFKGSASPSAYLESIAFPPTGYWLVAHNGTVFGLGGAPNLGNAYFSASSGDVVDIAGTPNGKGYWVVTSAGYVRAFGDAKFYGDPPALGVHPHDVTAIAPTLDGHGYWLIGKDGGMFSFGDARFHGSIPGLGLHVHDVVGMVASANGSGYLLVGADGGVFTFGSAHFYGSLPGIGKHVHDVQAILPSSTGKGYVLVGADGGAFIFGTGVHFLGSLPGEGIHVHDIVGIALTPDDGGYFMAASTGGVYGFGNGHPYPTPSGLASNLPVVAIAGT